MKIKWAKIEKVLLSNGLDQRLFVRVGVVLGDVGGVVVGVIVFGVSEDMTLELSSTENALRAAYLSVAKDAAKGIGNDMCG